MYVNFLAISFKARSVLRLSRTSSSTITRDRVILEPHKYPKLIGLPISQDENTSIETSHQFSRSPPSSIPG